MSMESSDRAAQAIAAGWSVTIFPPNIKLGGHYMSVEVSKGSIIKTRTLDMKDIGTMPNPDHYIAQVIGDLTS